MPIDNRTANLNLPLPNPGNALNDDVLRIIAALQSVDVALALKAPISNPTFTGAVGGITAAAIGAQVVLQSGANIKTMGGASLLGPGNISLLANYTYDSRATLRTLSPANGDAAVVKDLGFFVWESASTEPDDDESAFATTLGVWLLQAVHWDLVDSWQLPDQQIITDIGEVLSGSATCAITLVGSTNSASFTGTVTGATVGDRVIATPPAQLGSEGTNTGRLSYHAWVSGADTVTIMLTNASASAASTNILIQAVWPVTVIKT